MAKSSQTPVWPTVPKLVAKSGRDAFYRGPIARAIVADMRARDGLLDERDFSEHKSDSIDPIRTSYRGVDVLEMPPSTQGFVALEMLNIVKDTTSKPSITTPPTICTSLPRPRRSRLPIVRLAWPTATRCRRTRCRFLCRRTTPPRRRKEIDLQRAGTYRAGASSRARQTWQDELDFTGRDQATRILHCGCGRSRKRHFLQLGRCFPTSGPGSSPATPASRCTTAGRASIVADRPRPNRYRPPATHCIRSCHNDHEDASRGCHSASWAGDEPHPDFGMNIQKSRDSMRHGGQELSLESGIGEAVQQALATQVPQAPRRGAPWAVFRASLDQSTPPCPHRRECDPKRQARDWLVTE